MKHTLTILAVFVCSALVVTCTGACVEEPNQPVAAKPTETLTNASIVELQSLSLGDAVIIDKIKASKCDFDVSIDGLKLLKQAKVSDMVLQAMIASKAPAAPVGASVKAAVTGDPNDPNVPHTAGVYLYEEVDGQKKLTKIMPESATIVRGGGPYGGSTRAVLNDLRAKLQIKTRRPVFYMYLGKVVEDQLEGDKTPAQLPLVKFVLKEKKNNREVVIGSHGGGPFGSSHRMGIDDKFKTPFEQQEITPGVYRVTPQNDLTDGEYGFAHVTGGFAMAEGQMYCFGIHSE